MIHIYIRGTGGTVGESNTGDSLGTFDIVLYVLLYVNSQSNYLLSCSDDKFMCFPRDLSRVTFLDIMDFAIVSQTIFLRY